MGHPAECATVSSGGRDRRLYRDDRHDGPHDLHGPSAPHAFSSLPDSGRNEDVTNRLPHMVDAPSTP
jgi:hypothetical protein